MNINWYSFLWRKLEVLTWRGGHYRSSWSIPWLIPNAFSPLISLSAPDACMAVSFVFKTSWRTFKSSSVGVVIVSVTGGAGAMALGITLTSIPEDVVNVPDEWLHSLSFSLIAMDAGG